MDIWKDRKSAYVIYTVFVYFCFQTLITFNVTCNVLMLKKLITFWMRVEFYNLKSFWANNHASALDHDEYYIHN